MGESVDVKFLERLVDYLNKRYENRYPDPWDKKKFFFRKPRDIKMINLLDEHVEWRACTESGIYPEIEGLPNGDIVVWSATAGDPSEIISLSCELDHIKYTSSEIDRIWEMIPDRRNWDKLEGKYKKLVAWLRNADKVAEEVTEKNGVKTEFFIPSPKRYDRCHFFARFNPKGMSDEEKLRMIEKALNAVDEAQGRV